MRITQLYTYPIKSLRGVPLITGNLTCHGLQYDRCFMLVKVHNSTPQPRSKGHCHGNLENMTITYFLELSLFSQRIDETKGTLTILYNPPEGDRQVLNIQLEPDVADLEVMDVVLHRSPTKGYKMEKPVSDWFSSCLGYDVILAYLGPNRRPVLGNLSPEVVQNKSWFSGVTNSIPHMLGYKWEEEKPSITFADLAAYLVVTEESLHDVTSRLKEGTEMDITKFRPNIVLSGAQEAYEEDFWGGIVIHTAFGNDKAEGIEIALTQNCGRCVSITVDYSTGKPAAGEEGNVLKKLMKDRRVDSGNKYSPIFGRYGFLKSVWANQSIAIGDEVAVSKINKERTTFYWPGVA